MDICTDCGRKLTEGETAFVIDSKIVCGKCRRWKPLHKIAAFDALDEQKRRWIQEGFFKSIGWLPVALLCGILLFFGVKEYIAYRITDAYDTARARPHQDQTISLPRFYLDSTQP